MGAITVINNFQHCSVKELGALVDEKIDEVGREDGFGRYTGNWGSKRGNGFEIAASTIFESVALAKDYLANKVDKRGPLLAVKAYTGKLEHKASNKKPTKANGVKGWIWLVGADCPS